MLQQYLPFTVLKPPGYAQILLRAFELVATVLTVYGIETCNTLNLLLAGFMNVATVLTVYGIETLAYGTDARIFNSCNSTYRLRY